MARTDTLNNFLTDVADSIRTKKGTTDSIPASNFDTEIESIETSENLSDELNTYNTELTEQETSLKNIIKALQGKASGGGSTEPVVEPDYITDGLIAWFDGEDNVDENNHWNSRVGSDYIYQSSAEIQQSYNKFGWFKSNNAYKNNMMYSLLTSTDYYQEGYTVEVVGKVYSQANSKGVESTGGTLFGIARTVSPYIGLVGKDGKLHLFNHANQNLSYTVGYNNTFFCSMNYNTVAGRTGTSGNDSIYYSYNGKPYEYMKAYKSTNISNNNGTCSVLAYYKDSYRTAGEINCIRVYNRKLTDEEVAHNYEIDKARFNINELEG